MDSLDCNVAIVGRPNVGKSRLFNRLIGRRKAVIDKFAGVTRDIVVEKLIIKDKEFKLIDTGGIGLDKSQHLSKVVQQKTFQALEQSQIVIFVCDVKDAVRPLDEEIAKILRKHLKKVILVVNKCDNAELEKSKTEFYSLGLDDPIAVSAIHGRGITKLLDSVYEHLRSMKSSRKKESKQLINISIIGRPNVGKSSFLNSLLKEDRIIVDNAAGTTRDSIDVEFSYKGDDFLLIDTAGIRHKSKISERVIAYSIKRSQDSIKSSHICLILIDGWEGLVKDDARIINQAYQNGRGLVLVVNKWDLVDGITTNRYTNVLIRRMKKVQNIPVIFTSAKENINTLKSLRLAKTLYADLNQWIPTSSLNRTIKEAYNKHLPNSIDGRRRLKIYYSAQVKTSPPTMKLFVNNLDYIKNSYTLYLEGYLRRCFSLQGIPLKIIYEASHKKHISGRKRKR